MPHVIKKHQEIDCSTPHTGICRPKPHPPPRPPCYSACLPLHPRLSPNLPHVPRYPRTPPRPLSRHLPLPRLGPHNLQPHHNGRAAALRPNRPPCPRPHHLWRRRRILPIIIIRLLLLIFLLVDKRRTDRFLHHAHILLPLVSCVVSIQARIGHVSLIICPTSIPRDEGARAEYPCTR